MDVLALLILVPFYDVALLDYGGGGGASGASCRSAREAANASFTDAGGGGGALFWASAAEAVTFLVLDALAGGAGDLVEVDFALGFCGDEKFDPERDEGNGDLSGPVGARHDEFDSGVGWGVVMAIWYTSERKGAKVRKGRKRARKSGG